MYRPAGTGVHRLTTERKFSALSMDKHIHSKRNNCQFILINIIAAAVDYYINYLLMCILQSINIHTPK